MLARFSLVLALLSVVADPLPAAEIRSMNLDPYSNNSQACAYRLKGQIVRGDAAKLRRIATSEGDRIDRGYLCLDSPGGSFVEGIRLADVLYDLAISSRIEANTECISACGIAFLGGTGGEAAEGAYFRDHDRELHAAGRLGFHAPGAIFTERNYSKKEIERAFNTSMKSVSEIIARNDWLGFPRDFLIEMIATPLDDMLYVETIGQALDLNIVISGYRQPSQITESGAKAACNADFKGFRKSLYDTHYFGVQYWVDDGFFALPGDGEQSLLYWARTAAEDEVYFTGCNVRMLSSEAKHGRRAEIHINHAPAFNPYIGGEYPGKINHTKVFEHFRSAEHWGIAPYKVYPRATRLANIAIGIVGESSAKRRMTPEVAAPKEGRCRVFKQGQAIDDDPCNRTFGRMGTKLVETFFWPSGAKTVIVHESGGTTINGNITVEQERYKSIVGRCFLNTSSGNHFCYTGG